MPSSSNRSSRSPVRAVRHALSNAQADGSAAADTAAPRAAPESRRARSRNRAPTRALPADASGTLLAATNADGVHAFDARDAATRGTLYATAPALPASLTGAPPAHLAPAAPADADSSDEDEPELEDESSDDDAARSARVRAPSAAPGLTAPPATSLSARAHSSGAARLSDVGSMATGAPSAVDAAAVTSITEEAAKKSRNKWHDWTVRWITSLAMVAGILLYTYYGRQPGIVAFVFLVQMLIYRELVNIAINASREDDMPGFRIFYYWWFMVCAFYSYTTVLKQQAGAAIVHYANSFVADTLSQLDVSLRSPLQAAVAGLLRCVHFIFRNYVPITFVMYTMGFVAFVVSLRRRRHFRYQFAQFAYCHMALLVVVMQSTLIVANVFKGMLWFLLPASLVAANDSFAYVFGFLFGRTPLIRLSPKKTVEGFVGGAIATYVIGFGMTAVLQSTSAYGIQQLMLCPADDTFGFAAPTCDVAKLAGGLYVPQPLATFWFKDFVPAAFAAWTVSEMQLHALVLATFASMVAPFGGFFASGFKRAFKIKDFGSAIPGHGGFTDRMDCQVVMGGFCYMYSTYALPAGASSLALSIPHMFASLVAQYSAAQLTQLKLALECYLTATAPTAAGSVAPADALLQCSQLIGA